MSSSRESSSILCAHMVVCVWSSWHFSMNVDCGTGRHTSAVGLLISSRVLSRVLTSMKHISCNNNNNTNDNVYGAVIMAQSHCESSLGSCGKCRLSANTQTKPANLGCECASRLLQIYTTIAIYYYYLARKLILTLPSYGR